jgi:hypothetical protein
VLLLLPGQLEHSDAASPLYEPALHAVVHAIMRRVLSCQPSYSWTSVLWYAARTDAWRAGGAVGAGHAGSAGQRGARAGEGKARETQARRRSHAARAARRAWGAGQCTCTAVGASSTRWPAHAAYASVHS